MQEYLARLGIDTRGPPLTLANISHGASYQTLEGGDLTSMVSKSKSYFLKLCQLWLLRCTPGLLRTHVVTRTRWCPGETTRCTRGLDTPSLSQAPSQGKQIVCADCMQIVLSSTFGGFCSGLSSRGWPMHPRLYRAQFELRARFEMLQGTF